MTLADFLTASPVSDSVHRRNHKERAQPLARAKLGLLEKKKDYVLRARDYKSKKERLKRLREKAAFRNKDEFYWGMIKAKTQGGVHVQERNSSNTLGVDEVKLLKSQDAGYVRLAIAKDESVRPAHNMRGKPSENEKFKADRRAIVYA